MIKLVMTDLDDTLIPFGNPGVSDFARAAIHELLDAGVHFGPVSGMTRRASPRARSPTGRLSMWMAGCATRHRFPAT